MTLGDVVCIWALSVSQRRPPVLDALILRRWRLSSIFR